MNYGWGITQQQALPAVFGLEQEVAIYDITQRDEHISIRTNKPANQPKRLIQLEDKAHRNELTRFMNRFADEKYPIKRRIKRDGGYFVKDGRFYVDEMKNFELATAECSNPAEVSARLWSMRNNLTDFFKDNPRWTAYCDSGSIDSTLAFHENYFTLLDLPTIEHLLTPALIGTLVTRTILTGTGGCDRYGDLSISPRLSWIENATSIDSRYHRGFVLLRHEPHSNIGSRLQIISSDQIMSGENIQLQCGITALALRLAELGKLPKSNVDWFEVRDNLNVQPLDEPNMLFYYALEYQIELLDKAKEYVRQCRELGHPEIFTEVDATDQLLLLWESRLDSLSTYGRDHDLSIISDSCEWARKYEMIKSLRARHGQQFSGQLSVKERWACMEINAFVPFSDSFERLQKPFLTPPEYDLHRFSLPRAQLRADFIDSMQHLAGNVQNLTPEMTWSELGFSGEGVRTSLEIQTPFSGTKLDLIHFLEDLKDSNGILNRVYRARIAKGIGIERPLAISIKD